MDIDKENLENGQVDTAADEQGAQNEQQSELSACHAERDEWKERYARVVADLENYRKRVAKDQITWIQAGQVRVLTDLLDNVDDFDRACNEQPEVAPEAAAWVEGIMMIRGSFLKMLDKFGVKEMENYDSFDPEFHEAIAHVETDGVQSGEITEVVQKGYMLKDTVLRHARVCVAK